ncbi:MAG: threonylcarbamoyl-AMP synthase [Nitrospirae bacterium]|nr:threonylcarbamoyl-AMP synthase [Nitrospirota bacterium]
MTPARVAIDPAAPSPAALAEAARVVAAGGVIAWPTEHFYALGCDPANRAAVARLFTLKGRRMDKPALLAIATREALAGLIASVPAGAEKLVAVWPGGLTILFPAAPSVPPGIRSGAGTVGIRLIRDAPAAAILRACGGVLTATSANPSGRPASGDPERVIRDLPGVDLVLDAGPLPAGGHSTLLDVTRTPWRIRRAGMAPAAALAAFGPIADL